MERPGCVQAAPKVWGVSLSPACPSPDSGPPTLLHGTGGSQHIGLSALGPLPGVLSPLSVVAPSGPWVLAEMSSPWRPFLTPGILYWPVFSFVLCPFTGLRSMRTSSTHLLLPVAPSSKPRLICSLLPPRVLSVPHSSLSSLLFLARDVRWPPGCSPLIQCLINTSATAYHCPHSCLSLAG